TAAVQCQVEFFEAVVRCTRATGDKQHENAAILNSLREFVAPSGAWTDAFVVPDVEAKHVEALEFRVDRAGITVRIADEYIGFIALISREAFFHVSSKCSLRLP